MKRILLILAGLFLPGLCIFAQQDNKKLKSSIESYFSSYETSYTTPRDRCRVDKVCVNENDREISIYTNELFAAQPFTPEKVDNIYKAVITQLPSTYQSYNIKIYGKKFLIEDLIPNDIRKEADPSRLWDKRHYSGRPWVVNVNRPFVPKKGMQNRHVAVSASHGRYFKNATGIWQWQRPYLYCTTEDLLTQTFVIPFLIPMLENAGAYVFTPRERDWQSTEVIVDNDTPVKNGTYMEHNGKYQWANAGSGFSLNKDVYHDNENPFKQGTSRFTHAVNKKSQISTIKWIPDVPSDGQYGVYVSYFNSANNIPDATYEVCHKGIVTSFRVNQRMGGGTWVYIGTFDFEKGRPDKNYVTLTNYSNHEGIVCADAVRLGGGMGNIVRGDSVKAEASGLPRYLECSRYYAQWNGMPYDIYSSKNGTNDYADDINARSLMINYVAGGSPYLPADSGLNVPIELSVSVHTDAGIAADSAYIGTLGIYTTDFNNGLLAGGMNRLASRDLCDRVMTQIETDMKSLYGDWKRRVMYDRNYSESREPQIPSMILEMFSHQNFRDLTMGHDPTFKFQMARAIYKAILKYTSFQHGTDYVVQPLPIQDFYIQSDEEEHELTLHWSPQDDPLETTAKPTGYIVYTQKGNCGFDNGTYVRSTHFTLQAEKDCMYAFKITAVNDGGESFPSEILTAMQAKHPRAKVLIMDGFQRLAGPQVILNDTMRGFDLSYDPGVPYGKFPGYCGNQMIFAKEGETAGLSGNERESQLMMGNTFDGCLTHGIAIMHTKNISFTSASRSAVEKNKISLNEYNIVDIILGLQKDDGYSLNKYPSFTPELRNILKEYTRMRGGLLVSGAYMARDQRTTEGLEFLNNTLKISAYEPIRMDSTGMISGMNLAFNVYSIPNDKHYAVTHADCLMPCQGAYSTLVYWPYNYSAAVAYPGNDYRSIAMGFPFECIIDKDARNKIMQAFIKFLLER